MVLNEAIPEVKLKASNEIKSNDGNEGWVTEMLEQTFKQDAPHSLPCEKGVSRVDER